MHPYAQHPPIWFLVFPLVLCYGIPSSEPFSFFGILPSTVLIVRPAHPDFLILISSTVFIRVPTPSGKYPTSFTLWTHANKRMLGQMQCLRPGAQLGLWQEICVVFTAQCGSRSKSHGILCDSEVAWAPGICVKFTASTSKLDLNGMLRLTRSERGSDNRDFWSICDYNTIGSLWEYGNWFTFSYISSDAEGVEVEVFKHARAVT
jgi:hypothetical protein